MKYKKKPVVIEAVLFNGTVTWTEAPEWLIQATKKAPTEIGAISLGSMNGEATVHITTLEGVMRASKGDFIIRGVKGELYPCKPDIFEATYEPA